MSHRSATQSPLDTIPDPEAIRDRLSTIFAEAKLLRTLLKIAEDKERIEQRQLQPGHRQEDGVA